MKRLATTIKEFNEANSEEENDNELNIAQELLDDLIDAVGSEEEVEAAAEEAYNDLKNAHESDSIEILEDSVPENLAMSALIIKLVEQGKLDPKKADAFIGDHADD
jgi:hypothetical protein